jgi:hypothetical protein
MKYQGGNQLALQIEKQRLQIDDKEIIAVEENAHSFDFYRGYNHPIMEIDSVKAIYKEIKNKYFLLTTPLVNELQQGGYKIDTVVSVIDYNVARMKLKFMRPETRPGLLDTILLGKIKKPD